MPVHPLSSYLIALVKRLPAEEYPLSLLFKVRDGRCFCLNMTNEMHWRLFLLGVYENRETLILKSLLREGDFAIDVGANFGWYSTLFSRIVGSSGRVLSFEPVPATKRILERNLALNHCLHNTTSEQVALGSESGWAQIYVFRGLPDGQASISPQGRRDYTIYEIEMRTLDEILSGGQANPFLVKVDVEGAEKDVLMGAQETIKTNKPVIMLEINLHTAKSVGVSPTESLRILARFGYSFYRITGRFRLREVSSANMLKHGDNLLCVYDNAAFRERIGNRVRIGS